MTIRIGKPIDIQVGHGRCPTWMGILSRHPQVAQDEMNFVRRLGLQQAWTYSAT